ncbi:MAG TPA: type II toxin-antitoxin system VapC family toxin [Gammaproteobacteria bacterium]|nr:type II toxin-antitoxin system VapC family toxin [Gammaproteobacteria bacterium]
MIVVDVNVVVYLLTDSSCRTLAVRLYEQSHEWRVPPLWRHEMLNVLATLARNDVLDRASALRAWRNALDLLAAGEQQPDMEEVFALALAHGISAYDAQYVALAMALDTVLVSEDRKLQQRFPQRVVAMSRMAGED